MISRATKTFYYKITECFTIYIHFVSVTNIHQIFAEKNMFVTNSIQYCRMTLQHVVLTTNSCSSSRKSTHIKCFNKYMMGAILNIKQLWCVVLNNVLMHGPAICHNRRYATFKIKYIGLVHKAFFLTIMALHWILWGAWVSGTTLGLHNSHGNAL